MRKLLEGQRPGNLIDGRAVGPLITGVTISRGFTPGQKDGWALGPNKQRFPSESGAVQLVFSQLRWTSGGQVNAVTLPSRTTRFYRRRCDPSWQTYAPRCRPLPLA